MLWRAPGHSALASPPEEATAILVGAGDIADCKDLFGAEATAKLLDITPATVMAVGDLAYPDGSKENFQCYDKTWGRVKSRTRPAPGNHEFHAAGATPYFDYFGAAAGDPKTGYYSYELGAWHIIVFLSLFRFKPLQSLLSLTLCTLVFHFQYTQPQLPAGWEAVNTNYGGAGQGDPNFTTEYNTAQSIQSAIIESHAVVLLFPEHLITHWNDSTEAFWGDTLTAVGAQHRTVLLGAGINRPATPTNPFSQNRYLNVLLARGQENVAVYQERIPIPIAMWNPLGDEGVPLKLFARGTIRIHNQNAAVLICYEQVLVWPFLSSALEHPTVLLTASNDYWAKGTRIPAIQQSSAERLQPPLNIERLNGE